MGNFTSSTGGVQQNYTCQFSSVGSFIIQCQPGNTAGNIFICNSLQGTNEAWCSGVYCPQGNCENTQVLCSNNSGNVTCYSVLGKPNPDGPNFSNMSPTSGPVGTSVTITGSNLSQVTQLWSSNGLAIQFTGNDQTLNFVIPSNMANGPLLMAFPYNDGGIQIISGVLTTAFTVNSDAGSDNSHIWWIIGALVLIFLVIVITFIIIRKRKS